MPQIVRLPPPAMELLADRVLDELRRCLVGIVRRVGGGCPVLLLLMLRLLRLSVCCRRWWGCGFQPRIPPLLGTWPRHLPLRRIVLF